MQANIAELKANVQRPTSNAKALLRTEFLCAVGDDVVVPWEANGFPYKLLVRC
jgi:hypothetical protein